MQKALFSLSEALTNRSIRVCPEIQFVQELWVKFSSLLMYKKSG